MNSPKIVLLDLETAPNLGYAWQKWETDILEFKQSWFVLCFSYKWLHERRIHTRALPDYPSYKRSHRDDRALVKDLRELLDQADVVIAQNGDAFDIKKAKARFLYHQLKPPSYFKTVDTLKALRKYFKFDSNKLDDISKELKIGSKLPHTGWNLWKGCMNGDKKSWELMKRYNVHDIILLEKLYLRIRPWIENHPNLNLYYGTHKNCPVCSSKRYLSEGIRFSHSRAYRRLTCRDCGHPYKGELVVDKPIIR